MTISYLAYQSKTLTILLLGETGVGKSTFINGFFNYVKFNSLEEAEQGTPLVVIPQTYIITDNVTLEEKPITVGDLDINESQQKGQSCTQGCKSYVLKQGDKVLVRIIDTPGIGDTRGAEQDKVNFDNITQYLKKFEQVNAICVLLKPAESKLTTQFKFCLKEIFSHLNKECQKNIIFGFTHSRMSMFKAGSTLTILKELLGQLKKQNGMNLALSKDNYFSVDNEPTRYLAERSNDVEVDEDERLDYDISWIKSAKSIEKMIQYVSTLTPQKTSQIIEINEARKIFEALSKPIAELIRLNQSNIKILQMKQQEIQQCQDNLVSLKSKLNVSKEVLMEKEVSYPRTICTSAKCIGTVFANGQPQIHYKTICHSHCALHYMDSPEAKGGGIQYCYAFNLNGSPCNNCGCHWTQHHHITFEYEKQNVMVEDYDVQKNIDIQLSLKDRSSQFLRSLTTNINNRNNEANKITETSAIIASYLKQHSVQAFNDDLGEYLQHLIKEEKMLVNAGKPDGVLGALQKQLSEYEAQKKIFNNSKYEDLGYENKKFQAMVKKLEQLPETGYIIKSALQRNNMAHFIFPDEKVIQLESEVDDLSNEIDESASNASFGDAQGGSKVENDNDSLTSIDCHNPYKAETPQQDNDSDKASDTVIQEDDKSEGKQWTVLD